MSGTSSAPSTNPAPAGGSRQRPVLALVVPTYNYAVGIDRTLQRLARWQAERQDLEVCIVISDDGSSDRTVSAIKAFIDGPLTAEQRTRWRLVASSVNRGKGAAVRAGIRAAYAFAPDFIAFSDCDLYYGLALISDRIVRDLAEADLVIVDRSLGGRDRSLPWQRHLASSVFNWLTANLTPVTCRDTQAGLKGFRADTCKPLFDVLTIDGFAFDVELLAAAQVQRLTLCKVHVRPGARTTDSNTDLTTDALFKDNQGSTVSLATAPRMLLDLIKINRRWKRGDYGP